MAIVQQPMAWTTAGNVAHILAALSSAAAAGAQLVVFPELALTGYHRGIREEAAPDRVAAAIGDVQAACRALRVACTLGLPTFDAAGAVRNGYACIDAGGDLSAAVSKNGLTPAEQTFFAAGVDRPTFAFEGFACTAVLCREVEDADRVAEQLAATPVDLVFWPSLVGHPPGTVHPTPEDTADLGYVKRTAALAARLEAFVVQSNWPQALNTPDSTYLGESKVYGPDGRILLTLPRDAAGIGVFTLGESDCRWTSWPP